MREERQGGTFRPIIIISETVNEAMMMADAMRAYKIRRFQAGFCGGGGTPKDMIAPQLLSELKEMGY